MISSFGLNTALVSWFPSHVTGCCSFLWLLITGFPQNVVLGRLLFSLKYPVSCQIYIILPRLLLWALAMYGHLNVFRDTPNAPASTNRCLPSHPQINKRINIVNSGRCSSRNSEYSWVSLFPGPYTQCLSKLSWCPAHPSVLTVAFAVLSHQHYWCPLTGLCLSSCHYNPFFASIWKTFFLNLFV